MILNFHELLMVFNGVQHPFERVSYALFSEEFIERCSRQTYRRSFCRNHCSHECGSPSNGVIFRKEQGFLPNHGEEHDTLNHEASSNAIKRLHWSSAVGGKLCQPKLEFSSFDPLPFFVPTGNGGFRRSTRRFSFSASLEGQNLAGEPTKSSAGFRSGRRMGCRPSSPGRKSRLTRRRAPAIDSGW